MGASDANAEREDIASWATQHETKFYVDKLKLERDEMQSKITALNTTGEELTKSFYRIQGCVLGFDRAIELVELLAKGEE